MKYQFASPTLRKSGPHKMLTSPKSTRESKFMAQSRAAALSFGNQLGTRSPNDELLILSGLFMLFFISELAHGTFYFKSGPSR